MLTTRLSRLREHPSLRSLVQETSLSLSNLILPLFIKGEKGERVPISAMPGQDQIPLEHLASEAKEIESLGIPAVILFGIPPKKDPLGSDSTSDDGIIQKAIRLIKSAAPNLLVITDLCFCEYTSHGHCGIIKNGKLDHDQTRILLAKQALSHAKAGSDVVAPSGMVDGMVGSIRNALDENGFNHLPILSYSVKYCSSLYGPFRVAAEGAPQFGDRTSYQMNPANAKEALREAALDVQEGADMIMVKPALAYLDIIRRVKDAYPQVPLGAYFVSGEFAMLKAAAEKGWVDERKAALEIHQSIRRAGADFIITYYAKEFARWQKS